MTVALRYCLPRVTGRGGGLGNELIPWARAFLAAQVLGARALAPAFGLNRRRYWRHFGTPRLDWLAHRGMELLLPVVEFTESDYLEHGGGDVVLSFKAFAQSRGLFDRAAYAVVTEGMWGGYGHLAAARQFVQATLYASRFAARNLIRVRERLQPSRPVVAMHVRMGDFIPSSQTQDYRGRFNVSVPLQWYRDIAESICARLGDEVQFVIASDARPEALLSLTQGLPCVLTGDLPDSDCSDLLLLADADLLVCSVSSYSAWAAFLSSAPYLWYQPNLQVHPEGFFSIWGHEPQQQSPTGGTRRAIQAWQQDAGRLARGVPVGPDGAVPGHVFDDLLRHRRQADPNADLVQYGVVPVRAHNTRAVR